MRTKEEIQFQKKHEIKTRDTYVDILLPKSKNIRYTMDMIEKQNSRIELLDWVLEEGDFKK